MNVKVANRLIELRRRKGLSQEELADILGVSRQAVSKWERTEASPDTDNLIALAKFYNISLDELLDTGTPVDEILKDNKEEKEVLHAEDVDQKDRVNISNDGIHIESEDGESIHISKDGISINDNDDDDDDKEDKDFVFSFKDKNSFKQYMKKSLIENILSSVMMLAVAITYIILGTCTPGMTFGVNNLSAWGFFWFMFIYAPVPASLFKAIRKKKMSSFNYFLLVVGTYCLLGVLINGWHPFWFLFITIPLFYSVAKIIHRHRLLNKVKNIIK